MVGTDVKMKMKAEISMTIPHKIGPFSINEYTIRRDNFQGGKTEINRVVFDRKPSVGILLHDTKRDEFIMIQEFRSGSLIGGMPAWSTEIVAGSFERLDDNPVDVAIREVDEETPGARLVNIEEITTYIPSPGSCSERVHLFYAAVETSGLQNFGGLEHEDEDIKIVRIKPVDAFNEIGKTVISSLSIIALYWYAVEFNLMEKQIEDQ